LIEYRSIPRAQCLANDGVQIDKPARAKHGIELALASRVAAHQPLEGRRLVRRVVVDVHRRMRARRLDDRVDDPLEPTAFVAVGKRPHRSIAPVGRRESEQVLPASLDGKWIALEVEKQIARRWLGQATHSFRGFHREQFVQGRRLAA
jgi:hypothetical protein